MLGGWLVWKVLILLILVSIIKKQIKMSFFLEAVLKSKLKYILLKNWTWKNILSFIYVWNQNYNKMFGKLLNKKIKIGN
jgi:hypothetical protein